MKKVTKSTVENVLKKSSSVNQLITVLNTDGLTQPKNGTLMKSKAAKKSVNHVSRDIISILITNV